MPIISPHLTHLSRLRILGTVLASCANPIHQFQLLNPYKCLYNPTRIGKGGLGFNRWPGVVYRQDITPYFYGYLTYYSAIYCN